jgi:hypothetical protein
MNSSYDDLVPDMPGEDVTNYPLVSYDKTNQNKPNLNNSQSLNQTTNEAFGITDNFVSPEQVPADESQQSSDDKLNILNNKLKIIDKIVPNLMEKINETIEEYEGLKSKFNNETRKLLNLKVKYREDIQKFSEMLNNEPDIKKKYNLIFNDPNTDPDINNLVSAIEDVINKYAAQNNETIEKATKQGADFDEIKNRLSNFENTKSQLENTRNETINNMTATADNIIKQLKIMEENISPGSQVPGNKSVFLDETASDSAPVSDVAKTTAESQRTGGNQKKRNKPPKSKKRNKKTRSKKNKRTRKHRN